MAGYHEYIEQKMVNLYTSLNGKGRHCYAAIEAEKLVHPGLSWVEIEATAVKTIRRGTRVSCSMMIPPRIAFKKGRTPQCQLL